VVLDPGAVFANAGARQRLGLADGDPLRAAAGPGLADAAPGRPRGRRRPAAAGDGRGRRRRPFGLAGRLSRIDLRLAPGQRADELLRDLALPAGVRAADAGRRRAAPVDAVARLPRQPHGAGAGGAVRRRLPGVLGGVAVGGAAHAGLCAAGRAGPDGRRAAPPGAGRMCAAGRWLGSACSGCCWARRWPGRRCAAGRRPGRRLLPRRAPRCGLDPARPRCARCWAWPPRWPAAGCRRGRPSGWRRRRRSRAWAIPAAIHHPPGPAWCCWPPAWRWRCCRLWPACRWPPICRWRRCCSAAWRWCRRWCTLLLAFVGSPRRALPLLALPPRAPPARTASAAVAGVVASLALSRGADGDGGQLPRVSRPGSTACCRPTCMPAPPVTARRPTRPGSSAELRARRRCAARRGSACRPPRRGAAAGMPGPAGGDADGAAAGRRPASQLPLLGPAAAGGRARWASTSARRWSRCTAPASASTLRLPLATAGAAGAVVRGVWRDFARQFGAVAIDRATTSA
jgi:putative ABC transport system permease protein